MRRLAGLGRGGGGGPTGGGALIDPGPSSSRAGDEAGIVIGSLGLDSTWGGSTSRDSAMPGFSAVASSWFACADGGAPPEL